MICYNFFPVSAVSYNLKLTIFSQVLVLTSTCDHLLDIRELIMICEKVLTINLKAAIGKFQCQWQYRIFRYAKVFYNITKPS